MTSRDRRDLKMIKNFRILLFILLSCQMILRSSAFQKTVSLGAFSRLYAGFRGGSSFSTNTAGPTSPAFTQNQIIDINVQARREYRYQGDLLTLPFYQVGGDAASLDNGAKIEALKKKVPSSLPEKLHTAIASVLDDGYFKGELNSENIIRIIDSDRDVKYIALIGLGQEKKDRTDLTVHSAAVYGRKIAKIAASLNAQSVGVVLPKESKEAGIIQLLLGVYDGSYADYRFKKETEAVKEAKSKGIKGIELLGVDSEEIVSSMAVTARLAKFIASGVDFTKDLVGAPSNSKTPLAIAEEAKKLAQQYNLGIKILGKKECEELKMGGFLGVQQGSKFPPQFIHLHYTPPSADPNKLVKIALIGKGLTFDSGGYNLKVGASMIELMKFDMGGCGAVLGAAKAIAQLRPRDLEVHFISAVCENMVSAEAMRPGDILTTSNGKTVEVLNTDAEGRLTLADALVYAEKLGVDGIVDLATLTGACIVALGNKVAGLYSPHDNLRKALEDAARRSDEGLWSLPLEQTYKDSLKSRIADLKNIAGGREGGSITAALFLQEFVEKTPWAHIDMAGPVWDYSPPGNGGPTGYGVKTLVDFLLNVKKSTFTKMDQQE